MKREWFTLVFGMKWTYWVVVREWLLLKKMRTREEGKLVIIGSDGYGGVCDGEGGVVRTCWWWECVG